MTIRGDVFRLKPPRRPRGSEQRGARYAVVVQTTLLRDLSTVVIAPTSVRAAEASFRPGINVLGTRTKVLADQIRTVDPGRLGEHSGRLEPGELEAVDEALALVLGLELR